MLTPTVIEVNGREYTVTPTNPMDAFELYHELYAALRSGRSCASVHRKALAFCHDSEMDRSLGNAENFDAVFSKHPADMVPLAEKVVDALLRPFVEKNSDMKNDAKS